MDNIMKNVLIATMFTTLITTQVMASCPYNFDMTAAQNTQLDNGTSLFPSNTGQKVSFPVVATIGSAPTGYTALSSDYIGSVISGANANPPIYEPAADQLINSTGIVAFEYKFQVPNYQLPGLEELLGVVSAIGTNGNSNKMGIDVLYSNNRQGEKRGSNFFYVELKGTSPRPSITLPVTTGTYQRLGLYINQSTQQVGVIFNGTNYGYIGSFANKASALAYTAVVYENNIASTSPTLGTTISYELITDGSQLSFTYPTGSKDVCGNTL